MLSIIVASAVCVVYIVITENQRSETATCFLINDWSDALQVHLSLLPLLV